MQTLPTLRASGFIPRDHNALRDLRLSDITAIPIPEDTSSQITMLRSTVTTGSYVLEKYSRSYPSSAFSQTQSQSLPASQPEWQHFTNPIITLTLDVKKSMVNDFESVRLRIIWDMNAGHNGTQREIVMVRTEKAAYICAIRLERVYNFRKTSISCLFLVSIPKFTLRKVRPSKPSIGARQ